MTVWAEVARLQAENAGQRAEIERLTLVHEIYWKEIVRLRAEVETYRSMENAECHPAACRDESLWRAEIERQQAGVRDAIEALERGSTSAPVLEVLRALAAKDTEQAAFDCLGCGKPLQSYGRCYDCCEKNH